MPRTRVGSRVISERRKRRVPMRYLTFAVASSFVAWAGHGRAQAIEESVKVLVSTRLPAEPMSEEEFLPAAIEHRIIEELETRGYAVEALPWPPGTTEGAREDLRRAARARGAAVALAVEIEAPPGEVRLSLWDRTLDREMTRIVAVRGDEAPSIVSFAAAELVDADVKHSLLPTLLRLAASAPSRAPPSPPRARPGASLSIGSGLGAAVILRDGRIVPMALVALAVRFRLRGWVAIEGGLALAPSGDIGPEGTLRTTLRYGGLRVGVLVWGRPDHAALVADVSALTFAIAIDAEAAEGFLGRPAQKWGAAIGSGLRIFRRWGHVEIGLFARALFPTHSVRIEAAGRPRQTYEGIWLLGGGDVAWSFF